MTVVHRDDMTDTSNATMTTTETRDAAISNLRKFPTRENRFDEAPFYRKRWMVVVTALVLLPVTLLFLLTGPVYQNDGDVWDQKKRVTTAIALACLMAFTFIRLSTQPA